MDTRLDYEVAPFQHAAQAKRLSCVHPVREAAKLFPLANLESLQEAVNVRDPIDLDDSKRRREREHWRRLSFGWRQILFSWIKFEKKKLLNHNH